MARILLIEDAPDLGLYEAQLLVNAGNTVMRCNGGSSPLGACSMLRMGSCWLPESADLIVYSGSMSLPIRHRTYRGCDLVRAYRRHPVYGRKPMLVVSYEHVDGLEGSGPIARVEKNSAPKAIVDAVNSLLGIDRPRPPRASERAVW